MTTPKVSIIVPVYKTEKYLERCLQSLLHQTLADIEIILVDDGSPDRCPMLCDKAAAQDARVKVIHKQNEGLGYARNSGLEAASGQYIGFVDSDDYVKNDMYETLYNTAEQYRAQLVLSGVCYVGGDVFRGSEEPEERNFFETDTVFEGKSDMNRLMLGIVSALPHEKYDSRYGMSVWKNLYRRDVLETCGVRFKSEREVMSEDAIFMTDYVPHIQKAVGIRGALYCYCHNEDSLSNSYRPDRMERCLAFMQALENSLQRHVRPQTYRVYLNRLMQSLGRVVCSQEIMHAAAVNMSGRALRKRLKQICKTQALTAALKEYPIRKLPFKQAVFAFLMKYRLYALQKLVVTMRAR